MVLVLYRKREGARRMDEHGVFGRFRYNTKTCVYLRANGTGSSFEGNGRAPYPSVLRVRFLPLVTDFHYFFKSHPSRNPFSLPDLYLTVSPLAHPIRITK